MTKKAVSIIDGKKELVAVNDFDGTGFPFSANTDTVQEAIIDLATPGFGAQQVRVYRLGGTILPSGAQTLVQIVNGVLMHLKVD